LGCFSCAGTTSAGANIIPTIDFTDATAVTYTTCTPPAIASVASTALNSKIPTSVTCIAGYTALPTLAEKSCVACNGDASGNVIFTKNTGFLSNLATAYSATHTFGFKTCSITTANVISEYECMDGYLKVATKGCLSCAGVSGAGLNILPVGYLACVIGTAVGTVTTYAATGTAPTISSATCIVGDVANSV